MTSLAEVMLQFSWRFRCRVEVQSRKPRRGKRAKDLCKRMVVMRASGVGGESMKVV